jgi:hypothetical protein
MLAILFGACQEWEFIYRGHSYEIASDLSLISIYDFSLDAEEQPQSLQRHRLTQYINKQVSQRTECEDYAT